MDFDSVRKAADSIKAQFSGGIDVLCNNAGLMADEDRATTDGTVQTYTLRKHSTSQNYDLNL